MQSEDITRKLTTILVEIIGCNPEQVTTEAFITSGFGQPERHEGHTNIGADSLDVVEIIMAVEEEFGIDIDDNEAEKLTTVGQFVDHIERQLA